MFYYDSSFIILIPALLFSFYAQTKIQTTFNKYFKRRAFCGMSGAQVARKILDNNGLYNVQIELVRGKLSDHYDPAKRVLRLSEEVYYSDSLASIGIAAHEVGHAIQHQKSYAPLILRNSFVPVANIGSNLSWIFIIIGFAIRSLQLINFGILLFSAAVIFQIITLPVEFNASARALNQLEESSILNSQEIDGAKKVLNAAALTYVAATLVAISQLLRLILITRDSRD
ncbi:zinc metallopeptidase [Fervidicella metallireducens AeB]|uniref:Zinc metallopeptidase n=1 Tax=Fervidicella metallireducens AeB TaxID=1403537 RepID=A0A017RXF7_9CLOT|nr:zinc metallopeptidase [Fervidicella metallireducens]EYE89276.1 zinc metallopeptidase [Fervidicella metallireducens AeB]